MQMVHLNIMIVRFSKEQSNSGILAGSDSSKCDGRLQSTVYYIKRREIRVWQFNGGAKC